MKSFKPSKFGNDTVVEFTLDDDTKATHTIANLPIEDEEGTAFAEACERYGEALERGAKATERMPSEKVLEMKDKSQLTKKEVEKDLKTKK